jgi:hypothetical protein
LSDRSRAPNSIPHKISEELEEQIVQLRRQFPQMKRLGLARYEFTARGMKTGACFSVMGMRKV